jgi:hypothetical protein
MCSNENDDAIAGTKKHAKLLDIRVLEAMFPMTVSNMFLNMNKPIVGGVFGDAEVFDQF